MAEHYRFRYSEQELLDGMPVRHETLDRDSSAGVLAVFGLSDSAPCFEAVAMG
ncbi:hypothetical protein OG285_31560 [Streptomyces sp. NBC_01471]|uniref:hypothetical protein n=1 Tax=Streptomyces sp. NBC_01471 TaxID=2903879 RepID=UPI003249ADFE